MPAAKFELLLEAHFKRLAVEDVIAMKHQMIAAIYSNEGYNGPEAQTARMQAVDEIGEKAVQAIAKIRGGVEPEADQIPDTPFFRAMKVTTVDDSPEALGDAARELKLIQGGQPESPVAS